MESPVDYRIETAKAFLKAARCILDSGTSLTGADAKVVHTNCHEAIEQAFKYVLQAAGFSKGELRRFGHDLHRLARLLFECEEDLLIGEKLHPQPPVSLLGIVLKDAGDRSQITLGNFLEQLRDNASRYPSEVRYGRTIVTFPPEIWVQATGKVIEWAEAKAGKIRRVRRLTSC